MTYDQLIGYIQGRISTTLILWHIQETLTKEEIFEELRVLVDLIESEVEEYGIQ